MPNERDREPDHVDESRLRTTDELAEQGPGAWKSPRDEVALEQQAASSEAVEDSPVDLDPDRHLSEDEGRRPPPGIAHLPPDEEAAAEEPHAGYDPESYSEFGREHTGGERDKAAQGRRSQRVQDEDLGRGL
jgi:hypothetical protein